MADPSAPGSEVTTNSRRNENRKQLLLAIFATLLIVVVATYLAGVTSSSSPAESGVRSDENSTSQGGAIISFGLFGGCLVLWAISTLRSKRRPG